MVPGIKKIIRSYTDSAWMPFLLMVLFLSIASILVIAGGANTKNPLNHSTDLFIKLYAFSLLGQLYISFVNFFGKGTRTGTIQLVLFIVSLFLTFVLFIFVLVPYWRNVFEI
jgi:hypothetical protein